MVEAQPAVDTNAEKQEQLAEFNKFIAQAPTLLQTDPVRVRLYSPLTPWLDEKQTQIQSRQKPDSLFGDER